MCRYRLPSEIVWWCSRYLSQCSFSFWFGCRYRKFCNKGTNKLNQYGSDSGVWIFITYYSLLGDKLSIKGS